MKTVSRRNTVYLMSSRNKRAVIKVYSDKRRCQIEKENLILLQRYSVRVPSVIWQHENILIETFIKGETIGDLIYRGSVRWLAGLAEWFASLHKIRKKGKTFLRGDCNLKNFIFNGENVHGIDFEEVIYGNPAEDIGRLIFFILDSNSVITYREKIGIVQRFISLYEFHSQKSVDREILRRTFNEETRDAERRRRLYGN